MLMATTPGASRHRVFVWVLRIVLFGLGLNFIAEWIRTGAYREPFDPRPSTDGNLLGILVSILISGLGIGLLLLILGALVGPVTRHRSGWVALGVTVLGILAPLGGFGLIFGPGGGDQNTTWGGLGFMLILIGAPVGCMGYVWTVIVGIIELIKERQDRHNPDIRTPLHTE
jgi:hypothetical protein